MKGGKRRKKPTYSKAIMLTGVSGRRGDKLYGGGGVKNGGPSRKENPNTKGRDRTRV